MIENETSPRGYQCGAGLWNCVHNIFQPAYVVTAKTFSMGPIVSLEKFCLNEFLIK